MVISDRMGGRDRGEGIGSDPRLNVTHFRSAHNFLFKYTFQAYNIYLGNCKLCLTQKICFFPLCLPFSPLSDPKESFSADSKGKRESLMGTFHQYGGGGHFVGTLLPLPPGFPYYFLFGDILERRNLGIRLRDAVAKSCNCRQNCRAMPPFPR